MQLTYNTAYDIGRLIMQENCTLQYLRLFQTLSHEPLSERLYTTVQLRDICPASSRRTPEIHIFSQLWRQISPNFQHLLVTALFITRHSKIITLCKIKSLDFIFRHIRSIQSHKVMTEGQLLAFSSCPKVSGTHSQTLSIHQTQLTLTSGTLKYALSKLKIKMYY